MAIPRIRSLALVSGLALVAAAGAYHLGHEAGETSTRQAERDAELRANAVQVAQLTPQIERAAAAVATDTTNGTAARVAYRQARAAVQQLVDSLELEGLQLPPPVLELTKRGDALARQDSITVVDALAWGNLWKQKAELLEVRVTLLEGQLADEHHARTLERVKDVAGAGLVGAVLGALTALILAH